MRGLETETIQTGSRGWGINLILFIATIGTTLWMGGTSWNAVALARVKDPGFLDVLRAGVPYAVPLLAILLFHEMGHFIAGRIHKLSLSLPYFIPVPFALGTMGAIIVYKSKIGSVKKMADVSVAGPLSGIVVATIAMIIGLKMSTIGKLSPGMGVIIQEGQSLYYIFLKRMVLGTIPAGYDVFLHPVAWAAWVGLFVTMINLLPVGQLDGGHIAYSLLGVKQNRVSLCIHIAMVIFAILLGAYHGGFAIIEGKNIEEVLEGFFVGSFWLVWAVFLYILKKVGRGYHPPLSDEEKLGRKRRIFAWITLILFILLFMPVPIRVVVL